MNLAPLVLMLVTLQRLGELLIARRNTARLRSQGAIEVAPGHYPLLVGMHAAWLVGLWYFVVSRSLVSVCAALLAVFIALQALRVWVLVTMGSRWTTRIIVVPGEQLIARGPYRYLSHPNYWIVVGEILVLPLAFDLVWYGVAASLLNLILLWVRIGAENKALGR